MTKDNQERIRIAQAQTKQANDLFDHARYEEALVLYNKALKHTPDDPYILTNKGNTLFELGRKEEALVCFDQSLKLQPDDSVTLYNKGLVTRVSRGVYKYKLGPILVKLLEDYLEG